MKYVFFGSSDFSIIVLQKLINVGMLPQAVVCNPDRPVGRDHVLTPPPVKVLALEHSIPVLQPEKLSVESLAGYTDVDCFVVAAYAKIIPQEVLDIPRLGVVGVHPSLLPKYRGATPIQTVIAGGVPETGVSLFLVDSKVDHGPVIATSAPVAVDRGYYKDLEAELALVAGDLLIETLPKLLDATVKLEVQDEAAATLTKKLATSDGFVPFDEVQAAIAGDLDKAATIECKIRAYTPEPGVWTQVDSATFGELHVQNKRVKLLEAIVKPEGLVITQLQVEGKTPVRV